MRIKLYLLFCFALTTTMSLNGQTVYDTLVNYIDRNDYTLNNEVLQSLSNDECQINNNIAPKFMCEANIETIKKMADGNKNFIVKTYDLNSKLISVSLQNKYCRIGLYVEYYENGQYKLKGQYCKLNENETKNIKSDCPNAKDGVWIYYDISGKQTKKVIYNRGKIKK